MIILIGFGFVGQAVYASIKDKHQVRVIDPKRGTSTKDEDFQSMVNVENLYNENVIIVCVDTPMGVNEEIDINNFASVYNDTKNFKGLVIIKSTIPKYLIPKNDNWIYNPEFLNAVSANEDFANQKYIILGGERDQTERAEAFYNTSFNLTDVKYEHVTKDEASDFKYLRNIKQAYNLMYWEYVEEMTNNSRKFAQMMKNMPVGENSLVGMDGFRGFGGACLPKDIKAYNNLHKHKLTEYLLEYNEDFEEDYSGEL